MSDQLE